MRAPSNPLSLSSEDRARVEAVEALARRGTAGLEALLSDLDTQSWAVRRAIIGSLARMGTPAVSPLCDVLRHRRDSEARLAAAVEALVASTGEVDECVIALGEDANPAIVCDAAQVLGRRRSRRAVPLLATLTVHPDDNVAVAAIEALGRIGGGAAVDALLAALGSGNFFRIFPAIDVLGRSGDPSVVTPLLDLLADPFYVTEATRALGRTGQEAAVPALVGQLQRGTDAVMRVAAVALVEIHEAQVLGRRRSRRAVPLLAKLTVHPDDNVAVAAIEALGRIGGGAAVDALLAALGSGNFFRIFPAIDVLGRSGDPSVVTPLIGLLSDPFYVTEAARALGRTGQEAAVPALVGQLQRGTDAVMRVAAVALVEIHEAQVQRFGGARVVQSALRARPTGADLGRRLARCLSGADATEKAALSRLLGWVGGPDAAAGLLALLDAEPTVARASANALMELGNEADGPILQALREGDSARRLVLLPLVARRATAVPDVVVCLEDRDPMVRSLAADTLSRIGDASAVRALFERLGDDDPRVVQAAAAAIQSLGSEETEQLALGAARSADPRTRRAALRIISYFGYPRGLDVLLQAMREQDERLRDAAIYGLPFIDDPRAVDALLEAARHDSERTRAAAMRALGQTDKEARVTSCLLGGLNDKDPWVRYYACQSLGKLNEEAAADAIVALANDDAGQVRVAVVDALAHLHSESAMLALRRAATSEDADVRRAALLGLGVSKRPDALPVLIEAASQGDPATRLVALSAVAEYDAPETVMALLRAAGDPDESVRSAAVGFLATRPGTPATQALVSLLGDSALRERVVSALSLPAEGRIPGLLTALEAADELGAPLLVAALARMQRADARAALVSALDTSSPAGRRAVAAAVAALGTVEAREALERAAAQDDDPEVRRACLLALSR